MSAFDQQIDRIRAEIALSMAKQQAGLLSVKIRTIEATIVLERSNAKVAGREPDLEPLERSLAEAKAELLALEGKHGLRSGSGSLGTRIRGWFRRR